MLTDLATSLVTDALDMAISRRKPGRVVHHSDLGAKYTSATFCARCRQVGIIPSMGRKRTPRRRSLLYDGGRTSAQRPEP